MPLTPDQQKSLREVLVGAFTRGELRILVQDELHRSLESIVEGKNDADTAFDLVAWVVSNEGTTELISGALRAKPKNPALRTIASNLGLPIPEEKVVIPIIVVAMTETDVAALRAGTLLVKPEDQGRFRKFEEVLAAEQSALDINVLLQAYGKEREDWKPYSMDPRTIREMIRDIFTRLNENRESLPSNPRLEPHFVTAKFFDSAATRSAQIQLWRALEHKGCILVVDALSLLHPELRKILTDSQIESREQVALLVVIPPGPPPPAIHTWILEEITRPMVRASARYEDDLDLFCAFGVSDALTLRRWLFAILPETARIVEGRRPYPTNRSWLEVILGPADPAGSLAFSN